MKKLLLLLSLSCLGCSSNYPEYEFETETRTIEVERVFMHKYEYSVLYHKENSDVLRSMFLHEESSVDPGKRGNTTLKADAKPGEPMKLDIIRCKAVAANGKPLRDFEQFEKTNYVLHLHSAKEVNGGSYTYSTGKFTHEGETIPVE